MIGKKNIGTGHLPCCPPSDRILSSSEIGCAPCGIPQEILTDLGTQFVSAREREGAQHTFKEFLDQQGIKPMIAGVKHHQTNGKIERFYGEVERRIKTFRSVYEIVV